MNMLRSQVGRQFINGEPINALYSLDITVVNPRVDPTFGFMPLDHDGKIRMDCSSPYAMAGLIKLKDRFDIAFGNDPDADRHGIVTRSAGLMNPNHFLAVAIRYLLQNRPEWPRTSAVGKTLVSSSMIDRVVAKLLRPSLSNDAAALTTLRREAEVLGTAAHSVLVRRLGAVYLADQWGCLGG